MIHGFRDVGRSDRLVFGVLGVAIAGAISLASLNATARQNIGQAIGPVVSACSRFTAASGVPNSRLSSHLAGDHQERFVKEIPFSEIFDQRGEAAVEFGQ